MNNYAGKSFIPNWFLSAWYTTDTKPEFWKTRIREPLTQRYGFITNMTKNLFTSGQHFHFEHWTTAHWLAIIYLESIVLQLQRIRKLSFAHSRLTKQTWQICDSKRLSELKDNNNLKDYSKERKKLYKEVLSKMSISQLITLDTNSFYEMLNQFLPNFPFLYPLETSENLLIFWSFQGV